MKRNALITCLLLTAILASPGLMAQNNAQAPKPYVPDSPELYNTISRMDSLFFHAYNTCDMAAQEAFYSDSIEFYHDRGGLMTSKKDILEATKKNICGKVNRELVPGSIEVYPIKGYGAIEMGYHKFHNLVEKSVSEGSRFIIIWQQKNNQWILARVISLH